MPNCSTNIEKVGLRFFPPPGVIFLIKLASPPDTLFQDVITVSTITALKNLGSIKEWKDQIMEGFSSFKSSIIVFLSLASTIPT